MTDDVPATVAEILARHAPAAARMNDFCWRLFDGDIHADTLDTKAMMGAVRALEEEGANAVVLSDVPSGATAIGMPARVQDGSESG